jgi:hypothetical protein
MPSAISRVFSHRVAAPLASLLAVVLAVALALTIGQARQEEAFLKQRIVALSAQDTSQLQAQLTSCRATVKTFGQALAVTHARTTQVSNGHVTAADLVGNPPAGFDVCARMESADQAVLNSLK